MSIILTSLAHSTSSVTTSANFSSVATAMQEKWSFATENQYVTFEIPLEH